jgi:hypothetical protein
MQKIIINLNSIRTQVRRHARGECNGDECLYRIGKEAQLLDELDINQMQGGNLSSSCRSRVLAWLRANANRIGIT